MLTKIGIEAVNQLLQIEGSTLDYLIADVNEEELIVFSKVLSKIKVNELINAKPTVG